MKTKAVLYNIAKYVMLGVTIAATGVLIFEACLPSQESSIRSQSVGGAIGDLINDINGDTATIIMPESCSVKVDKTDYFVGESVTLNVTTTPSDATYKTYEFESSDNAIAKVEQNGVVSFLKKGNAKITIKNKDVKEVRTSVEFTVSDVLAASITTTILDATFDGEYYVLDVNSSYYLSTTVLPDNTTDKTVTYSYPSQSYISIKDDVITALKDSGNNYVSVTTKCGDIESIIKVKTYKPVEVIPLEGISASNIDKFIDQTGSFTPSIKYLPSNVSSQFLGYTLSSNDTSIVVVNSNNTSLSITGVVGSTSVIATSTYDPNITCSFTVNVKARPMLSSASFAPYSENIYINSTQTLKVNYTPNAKVSVSWLSSSLEVGTISSSGSFKALSVGSTLINATVKDLVYDTQIVLEATINVIPKPNNAATDFTIDYKHNDEIIPIIKMGETTNLGDYFGIDSFIGADEEPPNKNVSFTFNTSMYPLSMSGNNVTPTSIGQYYGRIVYTNVDSSKIYKDISFVVIAPFSFMDLEENPIESPLNIKVSKEMNLLIKDDLDENNKQLYSVLSDNEDSVSVSLDTLGISLKGKDAGVANIFVAPIITYIDENNEEVIKNLIDTEFVVVLTVNSSDIYTETLGVILRDKTNKIVAKSNEGIVLLMDDYFSFSPVYDEETTKKELEVIYDENIVSVHGGKIIPKTSGNINITFKETYSEVSETYLFKVRHHFLINEKNNLTITGSGQFDVENLTYSITNGTHATIKLNFDSKSTIKTTTYSVSDEEICQVSQTGLITPLKMGKVTLTLSIKDDVETYLEVDITINVLRRDFIQDWREFTIFIRKGAGHFGAFAVLGILTVVTCFLFFRKKLYLIGVIISYLHGLLIAMITEYIQVYVPGRSGNWNDVWLDYTGYIITVSAFTLVIFIIILVKFIKKLVKNKKAKLEKK